MRTRRGRKRLERAAERAMRPSRRASAGRAASAKTLFMRWSRWAWSWPGAILLLAIAVGAAMSYAPLLWSESPKPEVAKVPGPARIDEPAQAASEQRLAEVRQAHLRQLQPVLRTDAEKLSEIGRRIRADGRVTDIGKNRSDNAVELKSLFVRPSLERGPPESLRGVRSGKRAPAKERLRPGRGVSQGHVTGDGGTVSSSRRRAPAAGGCLVRFGEVPREGARDDSDHAIRRLSIHRSGALTRIRWHGDRGRRRARGIRRVHVVLARR